MGEADLQEIYVKWTDGGAKALIYSESGSKRVRIFEFANGLVAHDLELGGEGVVRRFAWSPDGSKLVVCRGNQVRVVEFTPGHIKQDRNFDDPLRGGYRQPPATHASLTGLKAEQVEGRRVYHAVFHGH